LAQENSWHSLSCEEVFERLKTSEDGLSSTDAAERLAKYGVNELGEEERTSRLALFVNQFKNPLIGVLIVATVISVLVAHFIDALVIAVVIILNVAIGFFQEYKAETALQALKSMAGPETKVIRKTGQRNESVEAKIKAKDVVPGDIIVLEAGAKVPADARIFQAFNLEIDESMLTGESQAITKNIDALSAELQVADRANMAFSGTIVVQGRGKAVVVATGTKTEIGKIAELIKGTERVETPIQKQTKDLSKKLGLFALLASIVVFVIAVLRGFDIFETFLFALATAVSAVPEGLPAVLTVTLAVGVNRMAKRHALIRKLQAVDTLGSATAICTDKTGTLTTNQMTVRKIYADNRLIDVTGEGFNPEGRFEFENQAIDAAQDKTLSRLLQIGVLCNDATLGRTDKENRVQWGIVGDPTEGALVVAAAKASLNKEKLEASYPRVDEIPFDSKERYMATFHKEAESNIGVFVKGAPEAILPLCTHLLEDGVAKALTKTAKQEFLDVSTQMASQALRVLAMAYQTISGDEIEKTKSEIKEKRGRLVFVGFAGMIDPPRKEAKSAVALCKRAGIRVIMATGDHKLTAEAIARELGITGSAGALTGVDLDAMNDAQLDEVIGKTSVFARVSPTHKFRIVESLRRQGHVVAMTGDGVNDAPALKAAEIGIAMGITGTDVTKETADMVLTDDNFASIVNAVEEGRVIFENIRKVVKYLISTNTGEIITILGALIFLPNAPLIFTAVQILWINLVTDGLLVIPLALEPKEENVMDLPPRKPKERIINRELIFSIIFVASFMAVGTLWFFAGGLNNGNLVKAQTLAFVTIALFQVFNSLNCRSRKLSFFKLGVSTNKWLLLAIVASFTLQVLVTELSFFQIAFGTTSLSILDWGMVILVSSSVFIADEIRKLILKNRNK
jgi:Ca2+-transporting ATPase